MTARGRKTNTGADSQSSSSTSALAPDAAVAPSTSSTTIADLLVTASAGAAAEREEVKVNNASATEMKHACDDALKRFLSRPELFKQIYTHTDVRLALGWLSVFVAAGTGLYGYKVDFEQSKPVVWAGLISYIVLTTLQALYAYFVEGDIVFVGKRKTFDKRIVTERLTISSTTLPPPPSKTSSSTPSPSAAPSYQLSLAFVRSTSGGKSLLSKGRTTVSRPYTSFFEEHGVLDQDIFENWLSAVVREVMEGNKSQ